MSSLSDCKSCFVREAVWDEPLPPPGCDAWILAVASAIMKENQLIKPLTGLPTTCTGCICTLSSSSRVHWATTEHHSSTHVAYNRHSIVGFANTAFHDFAKSLSWPCCRSTAAVLTAMQNRESCNVQPTHIFPISLFHFKNTIGLLSNWPL